MKTNAKTANPSHPVIPKKPPSTCHPEGAIATEGSPDRRHNKETLRCAQDDNYADDRLSAAENFCDELNDSRLWKIKISYQKRWTHLRRTQQSVKIQCVKPWRRSTGPKTPAGKAHAASNRYAGSPLKIALDHNGRFLTLLNRYITLRKKAPELANRMVPHLKILGLAATAGLLAALRISSQKTP